MFSRKYPLTIILMCSVLSCFSQQQAQAMEPELWRKLQEGKAIALMRHAIAPGNGDPAEFTLGDCTTQRNLSKEGQAQASRIGELIKSAGITQATVYSSQWCRCVDTANGLDFGTTETLSFLNSFYQNRSAETQQTADLQQWIEKRLENPENATMLPAVLVSHQVNITGLTGVYPSSGELLLVGYKEAQLVVLGSVETK